MIILDDLRSGDRKALAQGITMLESTKPSHRADAEELLELALRYSGDSIRIGLTGVPGVGKSTLIENLGNLVIEHGFKVAILAVDPSSTLSGGSIMGDKTRMHTLSTNDNAFIRPTPAGETVGGVARRTRDSIILCEAAGYNVIIIETVGVGQSETMVSEMTDMFVLMLLPGGGDELQGIKRGIMELADLVIVNKADGELRSAANVSAANIQQALRLIKPRHEGWRVPVIASSASENKNVSEIWAEVQKFKELRESKNTLVENRRQQASNWLWQETRELLLDKLKSHNKINSSLENLKSKVAEGVIPPTIAANQLVKEFLRENTE